MYMEQVIKGEQKDFCIAGDGALLYHDRLHVPSVGDLRKLILDEAHSSILPRPEEPFSQTLFFRLLNISN